MKIRDGYAARIFILVYTRFNRNFSLLLSRVGVAIFSVVYYLFYNIRLLSFIAIFPMVAT